MRYAIPFACIDSKFNMNWKKRCRVFPSHTFAATLEWCENPVKHYYEWHKGQNQKKYVAKKRSRKKSSNNTFIIYFNNFVKHQIKLLNKISLFFFIVVIFASRSLSLCQKWTLAMWEERKWRRLIFDFSQIFVHIAISVNGLWNARIISLLSCINWTGMASVLFCFVVCVTIFRGFVVFEYCFGILVWATLSA